MPFVLHTKSTSYHHMNVSYEYYDREISLLEGNV